MTTKHYVCCNPTDDTLIFYDSAEEARSAALHAIKDATDGDWHPEVFGICWGRVHESADVDELHEHGRGSACLENGGDGHGLCSAGVPLDADLGGKVTLHPHPVPEDDPLKARLAAALAEVARLTAALAEAEERAAGPFFATSDEFACYGRRLEPVIDDVLTARAERLEEGYEPEEWAAVVARWELCVEHGVHLSPCLDDDGEPAARVGSRQGFWWYDLRLTVTNGQPVLTAERRAGGAR